MELNKKLRGQKHHYNKARYQNKAKVVPKPTEKDSLNKIKEPPKEQAEKGKVLTSNWHRYEESSEEEKIDESTNFSLLAQAPISHGGHFQFKSDKNVESEFDFETLRKNKMFALDLYLLESGLSTIPFHKRCGLDESHFSEHELEKINKRSQHNKAQYESYLKINSITKDFLPPPLTESENKNIGEQQKNKEMCDNIDELFTKKVQPCKEISTKAQEEMSSSATNQPKTESVVKTDDLKQDKEALEEWLDDILND